MTMQKAHPQLRLAVVGGPAYDPLYTLLPAIGERLGLELDIVASAPHQDLNEIVARAAAEGPLPFDLISTHIKYAPSQHQWLLPLDSLIDANDLASFFPATLAHCRFDGELWQLPRNVDARLLHLRHDWLTDDSNRQAYAKRYQRDLRVPASWPELLDIAQFFAEPGAAGHKGPALREERPRKGFAFPGRSSGLFGTFYELLAMEGGELLDAALEPAFVSDAGAAALGTLRQMYLTHAVPAALPDWHFDEVSAAYRAGEVAMIGDWPGYFALHQDPATSVAAASLSIERYPPGPTGVRKVYAGSHSFAITRDCRDVAAAVALLRELTSYESQLFEARLGVFPARQDVARAIRREAPPGSLNAHRLNLLEATVQDDMLTFPQMAAYPEIEDAVWPLLQAGVTGTLDLHDALERAAGETLNIARKR
jgi:multiple sugar transport system substrate-binding protein